jgi:hypothetical protein
LCSDRKWQIISRNNIVLDNLDKHIFELIFAVEIKPSVEGQGINH